MATAHVEMHNEHRQWCSDQAMWRDEVSKWLRDAWEACRGLESLRNGFEELCKDLDAHSAALDKERAGVACHEHALAEYEKGKAGEGLVGMANLHQRFADRHAASEEAHQRLKQRHHEIFTHWLGLVNALKSDSAEPKKARRQTRMLVEA